MQEQGYFQTKDGLKLYYSWEGPSDAPTLLFCYGIVCSTLQWKYQMSYFKKNYRILFMDYRGHNQSETPDDYSKVSLEQLARDLGDLTEKLGTGPMPVLGHSLGVNIALEFYRLFPEKVSALILASGTPRDPFETMFQHNFLQSGFALVRKLYFAVPHLVEKFWKFQAVNPLNQEFIARYGFNKKYAKKADINEYLRITGTIDIGIFMQLMADFTRYNACPWLEEVRVPSLVIGGKLDKITPIQNQKIIAKLIPGAKFVIVSEGSHNAQMEFPKLVNSEIENFLSEIGKTKIAKASAGKKSKTKTSSKVSARVMKLPSKKKKTSLLTHMSKKPKQTSIRDVAE